MRLSMRLSLIAAAAPMLIICNAAAIAQVSGMAIPTPTIAATSPLGMGTGSTVSQTGIPLGSTEIVSAGVSPAPAGVTGSMSSGSTACSTLGTSPSGMYGSTANYDGGGMTVGATAPATAATSGMPATSGMVETSGMSGMCGSGSSNIASSSMPTSTSPTTPGGFARSGIPLGSIEIGNLGVSSAAAIPTMSASPMVGPVAASPVVPAMPAVTSPPAATSSFACPSPAHGSTPNVC
jgi:hypothetical protein